MATLSALPTEVVAGTAVDYTRSFTDYPANQGWSCVLYIAGASLLSITASASGASFVFAISNTQSAALAAGAYQWKEITTKTGKSYVAAEGTLLVSANILTARAGDLQSYAEKTLAVIEAALSGRLTADMQSYVILGRSVLKIPVLELQTLRSVYQAELWQERNGDRLGPPVRATFTGAESEV